MLNFLGIHPIDIEHADKVFLAVCQAQGLDDDTLYTRVRDHFIENYGDEFANTIIRMMFEELEWSLVNEHGVDRGSIDWYVNGTCSDFYINGEQAY